MSLKSHSNARNFVFDGFKNELRHLCPLNLIQTPEKIGGLQNELRHLCPLNRIQIFQNFIAIP